MRKLAMQELNRLSVQDFRGSKKLLVTLVLDNVRSLHNVGSVFRTADAFHVEQIILTGITGTPPHREIHKSALGATESVLWKYRESAASAVQSLRDEGYVIVAVEQTDVSVPVTQFPFDPGRRYALVFGNEVNGVSEAVLPLAHHAVEVPQAGTKHSLNISVCAGIVVWEFFRRLS
jgi:tRNA G18 (ribose-2'-O)-methylase SpoU